MSEINDFWSLDQTTMDKDRIKEKCVEHYTEDFINNYGKWKNNLIVFNDVIKAGLTGLIPADKYINMEFDFFCKEIIDMFKEHIDTFGRLQPEDIYPISVRLQERHYHNILQQTNVQHSNIASIVAQIKKFVIK